MRPQTVGPPERRMKNGERQRNIVGAGCKLDLPSSNHRLVCEVVYDQSRIYIICGDDFYISPEPGGGSADRFLHNMQIANAHFVPGLKPDGFPDAAGYEPRTPVPAKLVSGFARVRVGFLSLIIG